MHRKQIQIQKVIVMSHNIGAEDNNINTEKVGHTFDNSPSKETAQQIIIPSSNK